MVVWDFAGQHWYYNTHQMFLTRRSVVLLVVNIQKEDYSSGVLTWAKSLQAGIPGLNFVLVATHTHGMDPTELSERCAKLVKLLQDAEKEEVDTLNEWLEEAAKAEKESLTRPEANKSTVKAWDKVRNKFLQKPVGGVDITWYAGLKRQRAWRPVLPTEVVCIDSVAFEGFDQLQQVLEQASAPLLREKVPTSYMKLQEALDIERFKRPTILWGELMELANSSTKGTKGRLDGEGLHYAVKYLCAIGVLLYFDDNPMTSSSCTMKMFSAQRAAVFLDVQWFANALKYIARDWLHDPAPEEVAYQKTRALHPRTFEELMRNLRQNGELDQRLWDNFWMRLQPRLEPLLSCKSDLDAAERSGHLCLWAALKAALIYHGLLVELPKRDVFLVPSLVSNLARPDYILEAGEGQICVEHRIEWGSYTPPPPGLITRIIARVYNKLDQPQLWGRHPKEGSSASASTLVHTVPSSTCEACREDETNFVPGTGIFSHVLVREGEEGMEGLQVLLEEINEEDEHTLRIQVRGNKDQLDQGWIGEVLFEVVLKDAMHVISQYPGSVYSQVVVHPEDETSLHSLQELKGKTSVASKGRGRNQAGIELFLPKTRKESWGNADIKKVEEVMQEMCPRLMLLLPARKEDSPLEVLTAALKCRGHEPDSVNDVSNPVELHFMCESRLIPGGHKLLHAQASGHKSD